MVFFPFLLHLLGKPNGCFPRVCSQVFGGALVNFDLKHKHSFFFIRSFALQGNIFHWSGSIRTQFFGGAWRARGTGWGIIIGLFSFEINPSSIQSPGKSLSGWVFMRAGVTAWQGTVLHGACCPSRLSCRSRCSRCRCPWNHSPTWFLWRIRRFLLLNLFRGLDCAWLGRLLNHLLGLPCLGFCLWRTSGSRNTFSSSRIRLLARCIRKSPDVCRSKITLHLFSRRSFTSHIGVVSTCERSQQWLQSDRLLKDCDAVQACLKLFSLGAFSTLVGLSTDERWSTAKPQSASFLQEHTNWSLPMASRLARTHPLAPQHHQVTDFVGSWRSPKSVVQFGELVFGMLLFKGDSGFLFESKKSTESLLGIQSRQERILWCRPTTHPLKGRKSRWPNGVVAAVRRQSKGMRHRKRRFLSKKSNGSLFQDPDGALLSP